MTFTGISQTSSCLRFCLVLPLFALACTSPDQAAAPPKASSQPNGWPVPSAFPAEFEPPPQSCNATPPPRTDGTRSGPCLAILCHDELRVGLDVPGEWSGGTYRFEVRYDQKTATCEFRLPLQSCGEVAQACGDEVRIMMPKQISPCAPPYRHKFPVVTIRGTPASVHVRVDHDGTAVGESDVKPCYKHVPVGCNTCRSADVAMPLR
jgi:hypothetical protein